MRSWNNQIKKICVIAVYLCTILFLAACRDQGMQEVAGDLPTPTPFPTPVVPEKPTYTVERGTVVKTLEFTGRISPVREQELFFKTDGFVATVNIARGDRVQEGDILAELEIEDLQSQLAEAEIALQTSEINLAKAEQELEDQLQVAQLNLEKSKLQMAEENANADTASWASAEIELNRAQEQVADAAYELQKAEDRHWETEEQRLPFREALQRAEENLVIAEAQYNDLLASSGTDAISRQISQIDLTLAELEIEQLQRGVDPLLELDVEKARLNIQEIERQIADARLVAPFDGEILSVSIRAGDTAEARSTVMVLAQPEDLEVTAELGSEVLSEMSVGQEATIRLRNRPEQDFSGTVRQLPYPYGGGTVETEEEDTAARIAFDDPDVALELGELATVVIVLEEKDDVLWLPPAAIRTFQGRTFVVVQEEDGQRRVDVRLGIESDSRVEILEGVQEGQIVVGE